MTTSELIQKKICVTRKFLEDYFITAHNKISFHLLLTLFLTQKTPRLFNFHFKNKISLKNTSI